MIKGPAESGQKASSRKSSLTSRDGAAAASSQPLQSLSVAQWPLSAKQWQQLSTALRGDSKRCAYLLGEHYGVVGEAAADDINASERVDAFAEYILRRTQQVLIDAHDTYDGVMLQGNVLIFIQEHVEYLLGARRDEMLRRVQPLFHTLCNLSADNDASTTSTKSTAYRAELYHLRAQALTTLTLVLIVAADRDDNAVMPLYRTLVGRLLGIIERVSSPQDRLVRGVACQCLYELESARPGLLVFALGHLRSFMRAECSHVVQDYTTLYALVLQNATMALTRAIIDIGNEGASDATQTPSSLDAELRASNTSGTLNAMTLFLSTVDAPVACVRSTVPISADVSVRSVTPPPPPSSAWDNAAVDDIIREAEYVGAQLRRLCSDSAIRCMRHVLAATDVLPSERARTPALAQYGARRLHDSRLHLVHAVIAMYRTHPQLYGEQQVSLLAQRLCGSATRLHSGSTERLLAMQWLHHIDVLLSRSSQPLASSGKILSSAATRACTQASVFDTLPIVAEKLIATMDLKQGTVSNDDTLDVDRLMQSLCDFRAYAPEHRKPRVAFYVMARLLLLFPNTLFDAVYSQLLTVIVEYPAFIRTLVETIGAMEREGEAATRVMRRLLSRLNDVVIGLPTAKLASFLPLCAILVQQPYISAAPLLAALRRLVERQTDVHRFDVGAHVLEVCRLVILGDTAAATRYFEPLAAILRNMSIHCGDVVLRDHARFYWKLLENFSGARLRTILQEPRLDDIATSSGVDSFFAMPNLDAERRVTGERALSVRGPLSVAAEAAHTDKNKEVSDTECDELVKRARDSSLQLHVELDYELCFAPPSAAEETNDRASDAPVSAFAVVVEFGADRARLVGGLARVEAPVLARAGDAPATHRFSLRMHPRLPLPLDVGGDAFFNDYDGQLCACALAAPLRVPFDALLLPMRALFAQLNARTSPQQLFEATWRSLDTADASQSPRQANGGEGGADVRRFGGREEAVRFVSCSVDALIGSEVVRSFIVQDGQSSFDEEVDRDAPRRCVHFYAALPPHYVVVARIDERAGAAADRRIARPDEGARVHIRTDFWPILPHIDEWLDSVVAAVST